MFNKIKKAIEKSQGGKNGIFSIGECVVFVSLDGGLWHMSISHPSRYPTYDEMKEARYKYIDDKIPMAMIFPSKEEFVNVHNYCFHLWELKEKELNNIKL